MSERCRSFGAGGKKPAPVRGESLHRFDTVSVDGGQQESFDEHSGSDLVIIARVEISRNAATLRAAVGGDG